MNTHTVNAEKKSQRDVWIAAGVRTPFVRVDGPLLHRDSLTLSVPVARAMAEQVKGRIDFAVWGPVILNLAYNNLARELWLDAKLEPQAPTFTTIMQCSTSMIAVFEAAGMLGYGGTALAMAGGVESMTHVQVGLKQNLSDWLRRITQARGFGQRIKVLSKLRPSDIGLYVPQVKNRATGRSMGEHCEDMAQTWSIVARSRTNSPSRATGAPSPHRIAASLRISSYRSMGSPTMVSRVATPHSTSLRS